MSAGAMALAVGAANAETAFDTSSLHLDALSTPMVSQSLHLDALGMAPNSLHLDALGGLFASNSLHLDALGYGTSSLHLDALGMSQNSLHLDALGMSQRSLHLDALAFDPSSLHLDALSLHLDALSGNEAMLSGDADFFWGTFEPESLHLDALDFETNSLHLDALSLHLDALARMSTESLHLDALSLHLDALELHLDALAAIEGLELHLDALELHLDALSQLKELSLHLDALELHLDALDMGELELHLDALSDLSELSLHLDALSLHLDALDMEQLSLHLDALDYEELSLHLDALGGLDELSLHLDALSGAARQISAAYDSYQGMLGDARQAFGDLVRAETGENFNQGFLKGFLAKHGMNGDGFADFLRMTPGERNAMLIDFSDQLTTFLGIDHPDHWMSSVYWSPRVSEIAGYGQGVTVGVVDQAFDGRGGLASAPVTYGPVTEGQTHGLAVTGVLAGALDGEGVMGVAPRADLVLSNPFDANAEADEADVAASVLDVARAGASIINLSVGEAGYTFSDGWMDVFGRADIQAATQNALFVMAAGNDGAVQSTDVDFGALTTPDQIILVGALGLDGEIADFSNTAGDACFITNGACTPMMNRFLVAPGEMILVATPDGVGRASGTSFAAPMVAGAAALLQSRWGWLQDNPAATAEILFESATDLGAEGIDAIYGHGLLNVEASQRPLDLADLTFRTGTGSYSILDAGLTPELLARVEGRDTITVFEDVAGTYRDFELPVGLLEAAAIDPSLSLEQDVERYFAERLGVAAGSTQSVNGLNFSGLNGFTDASAIGEVALGGEASGWRLTLAARQPAHGLAVPAGELAFETHGTLTARESGLTLRFGQGDGALAFNQGPAFGMTSDHDVRTGGVNPLLGLASGGSYFSAAVPVGEKLTLSGGITGTSDADLVVNPFSGELAERVAGTEGYRAAAAVAALSYDLTDATAVSVGLTALRETDGFLGGQSVGSLSFGETSDSRSITVGIDSDLPRGLALSMSATVGRTDAGAATGGLLTVDEEGVVTTAYQAALTRTGLFGETDRLRLSVAQPLHVESGNLSVETLDVVDRRTGALGLVGDTIGLGGLERRYVGEVLYGAPVLDSRAEVALFGQVDSNPFLTPGGPVATGGLRFTVGF